LYYVTPLILVNTPGHMSRTLLDTLPATERDTALAAITTVLGANATVAIRPVTGGKSGALVYLVENDGRRFVLRFEGQASPLRNPHQYHAMRLAADAGIAPRLHYLDTDRQVAMMDFVEDRRLETYPGGPLGLARAIGAMLGAVRELPPFPCFMDHPDIVSRVWTNVCNTGLFAEGLLDAASERLVQIRETYVLQRDRYVSSHNDVTPRNVLFDGVRLWLIDWETGYRNDPLVDLATALDNFAPSPDLEEELLIASLGHRPDSGLRARLAQVRALTRLFYAGVLFSASASGLHTRPDLTVAAPTSAEFAQAIRTGELIPETPETSHVLGKMFLASFLSGAPPPGLPPLYMR
jgi:aminoglycoside phosphotransferase (APT) family kinase protein